MLENAERWWIYFIFNHVIIVISSHISEYERCTNDIKCAKEVVKLYMARYARVGFLLSCKQLFK